MCTSFCSRISTNLRHIIWVQSYCYSEQFCFVTSALSKVQLRFLLRVIGRRWEIRSQNIIAWWIKGMFSHISRFIKDYVRPVCIMTCRLSDRINMIKHRAIELANQDLRLMFLTLSLYIAESGKTCLIRMCLKLTYKLYLFRIDGTFYTDEIFCFQNVHLLFHYQI